MAYKTVGNLKSSVAGILQGLNVTSTVKNPNTAVERTAREMTVMLNIPEAVLRTQLSLYSKVFDYLAPSGMFATSVIDVRPQGLTRDPGGFVVKQPGEQFDREKGWQGTEIKASVEFISGTGVVRLASAVPTPSIELDPATATTGWATGGDANGLALDQTVLFQRPASLRFNLNANGSNGYIEKTISQVDLTNYPSVGVVFVAVYLPSPSSAISSIGVRVGTDKNNYYDVSSTTGFLGSWTSGNWLLIALNLANATTVGTVTVTKIAYTRVYFNFTSTVQLTNVYVGDIWISLPTPVTLLQKTDAIFQDTSKNFNQTITNDNDLVILNDAALVIFEYMCAVNIAGQQGGTLASNAIATLDQKLNGVRGYRGILVQAGLIDLYRADNPSQDARTVGSWYDD